MNHLRWKVYHGVYLVSPVSVVGESLEVDHKHLKVKMRIFFFKLEKYKYLRQTPKIKLLCGLLVFLAVRAVPGSKFSNKIG